MRNYFKHKLSTKAILILIATFLALSFLAYDTKVRQATSDPMLSLLLAQSIMQEGSLKPRLKDDMRPDDIHNDMSERYAYSPPGAPILSIPAAFIMNRAGLDMSNRKDLNRGQAIVLALLNPFIFILLFFLGRHFVSDNAAYLISLVSFLGSGLTSTLNTGLWSHNYGLLLTMTVILMLMRHQRYSNDAPNPYVIGALLFMAFLTRPSLWVLTIATLVYLMSRDKQLSLRATATYAGLMVCLTLFSLIQYGTFLPPYYLPGQGSIEFFTALPALLVSPSRGLLIYSPFLILVFAGSAYFFNGLKSNRLFLFPLGFAALTLLAAAILPHWHGGYGYGPRVLVDSMPAYVMMTFILWRYLTEHSTEKLRRIAVRSFLALGLVAIWINSYQGLYNNWTYTWNMYPPIETNASRIAFDFRHPQILASGESVKDKLLWYYDYRDRDVVLDQENMKLIDFDLSRPTGHIERGKHHLSANQAELAFEDFDRATTMSPPKAEAFYFRGTLQLQRGLNEQAIEDFTRSIELDPENISSFMKRGAAYDNTGQHSLALGDYASAASLAPPKDTALLKEIYFRRGIDNFRTRAYNNAISDLILAIEYGKNIPAAHYHIAASYYASRRYYDAAKAFREIIALYPGDEKARLYLINSMRKDADADTGAILNELKEFVVSTPSSEPIRAISRHYIGMESLGEEGMIASAKEKGTPVELCETYYLLAEQRLMHGFTIGARSLLKDGEKICPTDIPEYFLTRAMLRWLGR